MTKSKDNAATELTTDDLDMAVGGAEIGSAKYVKSEEHVKLSSKAEQSKKFEAAPREEKAKRE